MATIENLVPQSQRTKEEQREIARKGGKASGRKRRERKLIAEALRQVLDEPLAKGSRQTRLDGIAVKAIKKIFDDPNINDVKALAQILGEFKQTISTEGLTLNISASDEGRSNIDKIMNGE